MGSVVVVKLEVAAKPCPHLADVVLAVWVDLLVLDAVPQPLDENIVQGAALAIRADADPFLEEPFSAPKPPYNSQPKHLSRKPGP
jgi:hypothetical protein